MNFLCMWKQFKFRWRMALSPPLKTKSKKKWGTKHRSKPTKLCSWVCAHGYVYFHLSLFSCLNSITYSYFSCTQSKRGQASSSHVWLGFLSVVAFQSQTLEHCQSGKKKGLGIWIIMGTIKGGWANLDMAERKILWQTRKDKKKKQSAQIKTAI